ncbi:MAG: hypothetical protein GWO08_17545 [Gammaproteobacteria bacterium]|nr:hypothetical protein [Gammaproteobacteria bacterium]
MIPKIIFEEYHMVAIKSVKSVVLAPDNEHFCCLIADLKLNKLSDNKVDMVLHTL